MKKPIGIGLGLATLLSAFAGGNAENGFKVATKMGCMNCHSILGKGGRGPDLAKTERSDEWIDVQIINPASHNPQTKMPAFKKMSKKERADIIAYIRSVQPKKPTPAGG